MCNVHVISIFYVTYRFLYEMCNKLDLGDTPVTRDWKNGGNDT